MIRVAITDDHKLFVDGLERLLKETKKFEIVGKYYDGQSLLNDLPKLDVDMLVIDIEMGSLTGLDLIPRIKLSHSDIKIAILSMHEGGIFSQEAQALGADAYLTKSSEYSHIIDSLLKINEGEKVFSSPLRSSFQVSSPISERELEVLKLIVKGKTSEEIATDLAISPLTVKTHRKNMMKKLNAANSAELIRKVIERGYL